MAQRRSLNRRWSRRSMNGTGFLNQDSNMIDEDDQTIWWKHVPNDSNNFKVPIRPSLADSTASVLTSDSKVESSRISSEWWNVLENTTDNRTSTDEIVKVTTPTKDSDVESSESDVKIRNIVKKRVYLRKNRKSVGKDVFSQALDSSENDTESKENAATKRKTQISISNEHSPKRSRLSRPDKSLNTSASTDSEKVQKVRPKLLRHRARKSINNFDSILQDDDSDIGPSQNTPVKHDDRSSVVLRHNQSLGQSPQTEQNLSGSKGNEDNSLNKSRASERLPSLNVSNSIDQSQSFNLSERSSKNSLSKSQSSSTNQSLNKSNNSVESQSVNVSKSIERNQSLKRSMISEKNNSLNESTSLDERSVHRSKSLSLNKFEISEKYDSLNESTSLNEKSMHRSKSLSLNKSKISEKSNSLNESTSLDERSVHMSKSLSLNKSEISEKNNSLNKSTSLNEKSMHRRKNSSFHKSEIIEKNDSLNHSKSSDKNQLLNKFKSSDKNQILNISKSSGKNQLINRSKSSMKNESLKEFKNREKSQSLKRKSTRRSKSTSLNRWEVSEINSPGKNSGENQSLNHSTSIKNSLTADNSKTSEIITLQRRLSFSNTMNNDSENIIENIANEIGESHQQIEVPSQSNDVTSPQQQGEISHANETTEIDEESINEEENSSNHIEESSEQIKHSLELSADELPVEEQDDNIALHLSPINHELTPKNIENQNIEISKTQVRDSKYTASEYSSSVSSISEELKIQRSPSVASSANAHSSFRETSIHEDAGRTTIGSTRSRSIHPSAYNLPPMNRSGSSLDLTIDEPEEEAVIETNSARETMSPKTKETSETTKQTSTPIPSTQIPAPRQKKSIVKSAGKSTNISTIQRSVRDFLIPQAPPSRSHVEIPAADPDSDLCKKLRELKQQREHEKEIELATLRNVAPTGSKVKSIRKKPVMKKNPLDTTKHVDKAFIVNGKVYKPPRLPRPKHWATDRLYKFLWKKMTPKYGLATRVRSEKFVTYLAEVVGIITRRKKFENYQNEMENLMKRMAHLGIIITPNDFYDFCYDFLPYDFRAKVTPILQPGNRHTIPFDPDKIDQPILNK